MRRQATKTNDAIGIQGHQETNNEGRNEPLAAVVRNALHADRPHWCSRSQE